ncbi:MAG: sensor histidine kinase [Deltaproteobacteria bacterium]|nr:sensor histidine kinase [Deltaproteobacteria bacterium]
MAAKNRIESVGGVQDIQDKDFPYFRRLWKGVVVALLAVSFIPMLVIGGGMYAYTVSILEETTLDALRQEVSEHREAIDRFLAERTSDLRLLAANLGFEYLLSPGAVEKAFRSLQDELPCFSDLSVIDDQGRHLAYVGPYDLLSRNYSEAPWFKAVVQREVYISDVFTGFRMEPHFVIAVKRTTAEGFWIIRATVDTAYFDRMVSEVLSHRKGDAFMVNREGIFQTSPRVSGKLMGPSDLKKLRAFAGVRLEERPGEILVTAWLQRVPWVCVAKFDPSEIRRPLRKVRNLAIGVFIIGGMMIVGTVLLTTNYLVMRLETKRRSIRVLDDQLRHSSGMASSMHLAAGIIRDLNDSLSNIDLVTRWLEEMSHRNLTKEENLTEMRESLGQIKAEVDRARKTTERFSKATRRSLPVIKEVNMNGLLEEVLDLLERELHFNRITVNRDYQDPSPLVRSDPSKLRQVFQGLMLNAMTAIRKDGEITVSVRGHEKGVSVSVKDTGPGIPEDRVGKIFDPLYGAKPDGAGPGLSIYADIMQKLGGRIWVTSEPGQGATFTITVPYGFKTQEAQ